MVRTRTGRFSSAYSVWINRFFCIVHVVSSNPEIIQYRCYLCHLTLCVHGEAYSRLFKTACEHILLSTSAPRKEVRKSIIMIFQLWPTWLSLTLRLWCQAIAGVSVYYASRQWNYLAARLTNWAKWIECWHGILMHLLLLSMEVWIAIAGLSIRLRHLSLLSVWNRLLLWLWDVNVHGMMYVSYCCLVVSN